MGDPYHFVLAGGVIEEKTGYTHLEESNPNNLLGYHLINRKNSSRVFASSRNTPTIHDVVVMAFNFCTPRMTMHM
jgi:hypothetical protein